MSNPRRRVSRVFRAAVALALASATALAAPDSATSPTHPASASASTSPTHPPYLAPTHPTHSAPDFRPVPDSVLRSSDSVPAVSDSAVRSLNSVHGVSDSVVVRADSGSGIRFSEWREVSPELSGAAADFPGLSAGTGSFEFSSRPGLGERVREAAFSGGVLGGNPLRDLHSRASGQWRAAAIAALNGHDADLAPDFGRWWRDYRRGQARRLRGAADSAVSAVAGFVEDEARARLGFVRSVDLEFRTALGNRPGQAAIDVLGPLRETPDSVVLWQLRGFATDDDSRGGNVGILYRADIGGAMAGVNLFADHLHRSDHGNFWRYSFGGELRSPWADVFANRYAAVSDPKRIAGGLDLAASDRIAVYNEWIYTASGYDAELHLHSPDYQWISAVLSYYLWEGEMGDGDETGLRYGAKIQPTFWPGLAAEIEYDNPDDGTGEFGGRFSYSRVLEELPGGVRRSRGFHPGDVLYAPARRDYSQRIRTHREVNAGLGEIKVLAVAGTIRARLPNPHNPVHAEGAVWEVLEAGRNPNVVPVAAVGPNSESATLWTRTNSSRTSWSGSAFSGGDCASPFSAAHSGGTEMTVGAFGFPANLPLSADASGGCVALELADEMTATLSAPTYLAPDDSAMSVQILDGGKLPALESGQLQAAFERFGGERVLSVPGGMVRAVRPDPAAFRAIRTSGGEFRLTVQDGGVVLEADVARAGESAALSVLADVAGTYDCDRGEGLEHLSSEGPVQTDCRHAAGSGVVQLVPPASGTESPPFELSHGDLQLQAAFAAGALSASEPFDFRLPESEALTIALDSGALRFVVYSGGASGNFLPLTLELRERSSGGSGGAAAVLVYNRETRNGGVYLESGEIAALSDPANSLSCPAGTGERLDGTFLVYASCGDPDNRPDIPTVSGGMARTADGYVGPLFRATGVGERVRFSVLHAGSPPLFSVPDSEKGVVRSNGPLSGGPADGDGRVYVVTVEAVAGAGTSASAARSYVVLTVSVAAPVAPMARRVVAGFSESAMDASAPVLARGLVATGYELADPTDSDLVVLNRGSDGAAGSEVMLRSAAAELVGRRIAVVVAARGISATGLQDRDYAPQGAGEFLGEVRVTANILLVGPGGAATVTLNPLSDQDTVPIDLAAFPAAAGITGAVFVADDNFPACGDVAAANVCRDGRAGVRVRRAVPGSATGVSGKWVAVGDSFLGDIRVSAEVRVSPGPIFLRAENRDGGMAELNAGFYLGEDGEPAVSTFTRLLPPEGGIEMSIALRPDRGEAPELSLVGDSAFLPGLGFESASGSGVGVLRLDAGYDPLDGGAFTITAFVRAVRTAQWRDGNNPPPVAERVLPVRIHSGAPAFTYIADFPGSVAAAVNDSSPRTATDIDFAPAVLRLRDGSRSLPVGVAATMVRYEVEEVRGNLSPGLVSVPDSSVARVRIAGDPEGDHLNYRGTVVVVARPDLPAAAPYRGFAEGSRATMTYDFRPAYRLAFDDAATTIRIVNNIGRSGTSRVYRVPERPRLYRGSREIPAGELFDVAFSVVPPDPNPCPDEPREARDAAQGPFGLCVLSLYNDSVRGPAVSFWGLGRGTLSAAADAVLEASASLSLTPERAALWSPREGSAVVLTDSISVRAEATHLLATIYRFGGIDYLQLAATIQTRYTFQPGLNYSYIPGPATLAHFGELDERDYFFAVGAADTDGSFRTRYDIVENEHEVPPDTCLNWAVGSGINQMDLSTNYLERSEASAYCKINSRFTASDAAEMCADRGLRLPTGAEFFNLFYKTVSLNTSVRPEMALSESDTPVGFRAGMTVSVALGGDEPATQTRYIPQLNDGTSEHTRLLIDAGRLQFQHNLDAGRLAAASVLEADAAVEIHYGAWVTEVNRDGEVVTLLADPRSGVPAVGYFRGDTYDENDPVDGSRYLFSRWALNAYPGYPVASPAYPFDSGETIPAPVFESYVTIGAGRIRVPVPPGPRSGWSRYEYRDFSGELLTMYREPPGANYPDGPKNTIDFPEPVTLAAATRTRLDNECDEVGTPTTYTSTVTMGVEVGTTARACIITPPRPNSSGDSVAGCYYDRDANFNPSRARWDLNGFAGLALPSCRAALNRCVDDSDTYHYNLAPDAVEMTVGSAVTVIDHGNPFAACEFRAHTFGFGFAHWFYHQLERNEFPTSEQTDIINSIAPMVLYTPEADLRDEVFADDGRSIRGVGYAANVDASLPEFGGRPGQSPVVTYFNGPKHGPYNLTPHWELRPHLRKPAAEETHGVVCVSDGRTGPERRFRGAVFTGDAGSATLRLAGAEGREVSRVTVTMVGESIGGLIRLAPEDGLVSGSEWRALDAAAAETLGAKLEVFYDPSRVSVERSASDPFGFRAFAASGLTAADGTRTRIRAVLSQPFGADAEYLVEVGYKAAATNPDLRESGAAATEFGGVALANAGARAEVSHRGGVFGVRAEGANTGYSNGVPAGSPAFEMVYAGRRGGLHYLADDADGGGRSAETARRVCEVDDNWRLPTTGEYLDFARPARYGLPNPLFHPLDSEEARLDGRCGGQVGTAYPHGGGIGASARGWVCDFSTPRKDLDGNDVNACYYWANPTYADDVDLDKVEYNSELIRSCAEVLPVCPAYEFANNPFTECIGGAQVADRASGHSVRVRLAEGPGSAEVAGLSGRPGYQVYQLRGSRRSEGDATAFGFARGGFGPTMAAVALPAGRNADGTAADLFVRGSGGAESSGESFVSPGISGWLESESLLPPGTGIRYVCVREESGGVPRVRPAEFSGASFSSDDGAGGLSEEERTGPLDGYSAREDYVLTRPGDAPGVYRLTAEVWRYEREAGSGVAVRRPAGGADVEYFPMFRADGADGGFGRPPVGSAISGGGRAGMAVAEISPLDPLVSDSWPRASAGADYGEHFGRLQAVMGAGFPPSYARVWFSAADWDPDAAVSTVTVSADDLYAGASFSDGVVEWEAAAGTALTLSASFWVSGASGIRETGTGFYEVASDPPPGGGLRTTVFADDSGRSVLELRSDSARRSGTREIGVRAVFDWAGFELTTDVWDEPPYSRERRVFVSRTTESRARAGTGSARVVAHWIPLSASGELVPGATLVAGGTEFVYRGRRRDLHYAESAGRMSAGAAETACSLVGDGWRLARLGEFAGFGDAVSEWTAAAVSADAPAGYAAGMTIWHGGGRTDRDWFSAPNHGDGVFVSERLRDGSRSAAAAAGAGVRAYAAGSDGARAGCVFPAFGLGFAAVQAERVSEAAISPSAGTDAFWRGAFDGDAFALSVRLRRFGADGGWIEDSADGARLELVGDAAGDFVLFRAGGANGGGGVGVGAVSVSPRLVTVTVRVYPPTGAAGELAVTVFGGGRLATHLGWRRGMEVIRARGAFCPAGYPYRAPTIAEAAALSSDGESVALGAPGFAIPPFPAGAADLSGVRFSPQAGDFSAVGDFVAADVAAVQFAVDGNGVEWRYGVEDGAARLVRRGEVSHSYCVAAPLLSEADLVPAGERRVRATVGNDFAGAIATLSGGAGVWIRAADALPSWLGLGSDGELFLRERIAAGTSRGHVFEAHAVRDGNAAGRMTIDVGVSGFGFASEVSESVMSSVAVSAGTTLGMLVAAGSGAGDFRTAAGGNDFRVDAATGEVTAARDLEVGFRGTGVFVATPGGGSGILGELRFEFSFEVRAPEQRTAGGVLTYSSRRSSVGTDDSDAPASVVIKFARKRATHYQPAAGAAESPVPTLERRDE